jgi:H+/Cl- antiporter ClcA
MAAGRLDPTIPPTLGTPGSPGFWLAVVLTGIGSGVAAALLTRLLDWIQHGLWPGGDLLEAATAAGPWYHVEILLGAGALVSLAQFVLARLTSANGIDIAEAITRHAGRLPAVRTVGSAVLSIVVVGMGASLGREGAPKQVGAVVANACADRGKLSDEQRRLLVACGAGAGMAAAYGVPLGGALFALEVLRGVLALRLILPALLSAAVATGVSFLALPDAPTYALPVYPSSAAVVLWAALAGPLLGVVAVAYVRVIAWADRHKPRSWGRYVVPVFALGAIGVLSIPFPQLLGNGKDLAQECFAARLAPPLLLPLLFLRPLATTICLGSGVPGGLFTPSLALGALLGSALGAVGTAFWPSLPPGLCALLGATAVLAATTHGPISSLVLMMELTARDRSFLLPAIVVVVTATVVARSMDARSIYDARYSNREFGALQEQRKPSAT